MIAYSGMLTPKSFTPKYTPVDYRSAFDVSKYLKRPAPVKTPVATPKVVPPPTLDTKS